MRTALLLLMAAALTASAEPAGLPDDVSAFLAERESCDHWRGEDGYDADRRAEISWSVCQYCAGTDRKLASLKKKYRLSKQVMDRLTGLESHIEPGPAARQCRASRKSRWVG
ncbi:hypothetical protein ACHMW6_30940 [Pseudoduganella sp. UC29_106]|uniref:hypothetical protein n=1 Tax=Pseudoduganella sp. UC29_106 TaxID=3374553 RepID=UPI0037563140